MAEDDIYGNKARCEWFKANLNFLLVEPAQQSQHRRGRRKYFCKNPDNLQYFRALIAHIEGKDLSYIHRLRLLNSLCLVCHATTKNLADCTREDINDIMAFMHGVYQSPKSKANFVKSIKYIWRILLPDIDEQRRPDETLMPYPVRQLSTHIDKSRQKLRKDKLSWEEFERLVNYFSNEPRMQAYLFLSLESLARPQELLYVKISDVELHDNYAKIYISEHGKEGPGLLQCIDSYPYLLKWLNVHPLKKNKEAFLFLNTGNTNRCMQLKPTNINKMIHKACKTLGIDKPVTCYSLKRNGVTIRRLRGESDMEIQHAARWTSTTQLRTYDLSSQDEAFKRELQKRGLIPVENGEVFAMQRCTYCDKVAGFGEVVCQQCKRPLDRNAIREEVKQKDREIEQLRREFAEQLSAIKQQVVQELAREILQIKNGGAHRENGDLRQISRRKSLPDNGKVFAFPLKDSAN